MIKKLVTEGQLSKGWKQTYTTSIFKRGNRRKCENYRGIIVLFTMKKEEIQNKTGVEHA